MFRSCDGVQRLRRQNEVVPVENFDRSRSNGQIHVVSPSQITTYRLASRTSGPRLLTRQFSDDKKTCVFQTVNIGEALDNVIMDLRR